MSIKQNYKIWGWSFASLFNVALRPGGGTASRHLLKCGCCPRTGSVVASTDENVDQLTMLLQMTLQTLCNVQYQNPSHTSYIVCIFPGPPAAGEYVRFLAISASQCQTNVGQKRKLFCLLASSSSYMLLAVLGCLLLGSFFYHLDVYYNISLGCLLQSQCISMPKKQAKEKAI